MPEQVLKIRAILPAIGNAQVLHGSGLRFVPVTHYGNQARSPEEVETIADIVHKYLSGASPGETKT